MKKLSLLLMLLCVTTGLVMPASAQVRLGVIGGLNLASFRFAPGPVPGISKTMAFGAGSIMQIRLAENWALQLEPMYLQKGAKLESNFFEFGFDSSQAFSMNVKFKLNYLEVPAMLKLDIGKGATNTYVMAGPIVGFRMSAKLTGSLSDAGMNQKIDEDIKGQTKGIDFGIGFGGGVSFPAGANAIFIQGRYTFGLADINDDPDDPETKIKTSGLQVMTGIAFPLGQ